MMVGNPRTTTLTVTVTGANDLPSFMVSAQPASIAESAGDSTNQNIAATSVTLSVSDLDAGPTT